MRKRKPLLGDLVRILNVPDQPKWVRDLAGQVGLVVEAYGELSRSRYAVAIGGSIHRGIHHLDLEVVNGQQ